MSDLPAEPTISNEELERFRTDSREALDRAQEALRHTEVLLLAAALFNSQDASPTHGGSEQERMLDEPAAT